MANKKQQPLFSNRSLPYYAVRGTQRIGLLITALATFSIYGLIFSISLFTPFFPANQDLQIQKAFIELFVDVKDGLTVAAATLALLSIAASLALLSFPRVQKHQKQLVADGVVIGIALFVLAVMADAVVRYFFGLVL